MSMPPERHSKVESLLKAWAQKRRAQAGGDFGLHPANRRLLQDEVTREFRKPRVQRGAWWWQSVWARIGLACGLVVLVVGIVIWQGRPARMEVAKVDQLAEPQREFKERSLLKATPDEKSEALANRSRPPLGRTEPMSSLAAESSTTAASAFKSPVPAAAPAPQIAARKSAPVSQSGVDNDKKLAAAPPELQLAFAQTQTSTRALATGGKLEAAGLLGSFTIQRNGQKVRVIDSDGSIYDGDVVVTNVIGQADQFRSDIVTNAPVQEQAFGFRVSGVSKLLNREVVFSGTVSLPQGAGVQAQGGLGGGGFAGAVEDQSLDKAKRAEITPRASVSGNLLIGETNSVPIQAVQR